MQFKTAYACGNAAMPQRRRLRKRCEHRFMGQLHRCLFSFPLVSGRCRACSVAQLAGAASNPCRHSAGVSQVNRDRAVRSHSRKSFSVSGTVNPTTLGAREAGPGARARLMARIIGSQGKSLGTAIGLPCASSQVTTSATFHPFERGLGKPGMARQR